MDSQFRRSILLPPLNIWKERYVRHPPSGLDSQGNNYFEGGAVADLRILSPCTE